MAGIPDRCTAHLEDFNIPEPIPPLADLRARFSAVYTGLLTDVLDRHGHHDQTLPSYFSPLSPGMRLAGPAFPIEGHPQPGVDYDTSIRKVLAMLGAAPAEHVLVYQTNDTTSAHLGELSVTALAKRGCAGAVIDGGCRDVEYILRNDFPVFSRYKTPQDCIPRWELTSFGESVSVESVRVNPGDFVVADADGIVVVPAGLVLTVIGDAEAMMGTENTIRTAVRAGMAPLAAYEEHGLF